LTAVSATAAAGPVARSAVSHPGSRYSATVMLAAIRTRDSRSRRSAVTAAEVAATVLNDGADVGSSRDPTCRRACAPSQSAVMS
jgi:hypothetical protein